MALQPWSTRAAAATVRAFSFGDYSQTALNANYLKYSDPSTQFPAEEPDPVYGVPRIWARRDTTVLTPAGHPSLRFDWPEGYCMNGLSNCAAVRGIGAIPFNDTPLSADSLGTDTEMWIQYVYRVTPGMVQANGIMKPTGVLLGGMKLSSVEYGDYGIGRFGTNAETEIVLQFTGARGGVLQGYFGQYKDTTPYPGFPPLYPTAAAMDRFIDGDYQFQNMTDCRYNRDRDLTVSYDEATTYANGTRYLNPCVRIVPDQWWQIKMHIVIGPKWYFFGDGDYTPATMGRWRLWFGPAGAAPTLLMDYPYNYCWDMNISGIGNWPGRYPSLGPPRASSTILSSTSGQRVFPYTFATRSGGDLRIDVNNPLGPDGPYPSPYGSRNFLNMPGFRWGSVPWNAYTVDTAARTVNFTNALPTGTRVDIVKMNDLEKLVLFPFDYTHHCNPYRDASGNHRPGGDFNQGGAQNPDGTPDPYPPLPHPAFSIYYGDVLFSRTPIEDVAIESGVLPSPPRTFSFAGTGVFVP